MHFGHLGGSDDHLFGFLFVEQYVTASGPGFEVIHVHMSEGTLVCSAGRRSYHQHFGGG